MPQVNVAAIVSKAAMTTEVAETVSAEVATMPTVSAEVSTVSATMSTVTATMSTVTATMSATMPTVLRGRIRYNEGRCR
jgi:hypothetical protein